MQRARDLLRYYDIIFVLSWMYFDTLQMSTGLCAKVHKKNFKKLIIRETSPVEWNQSKFKSAQLFYFYYFSPLKAHKG